METTRTKDIEKPDDKEENYLNEKLDVDSLSVNFENIPNSFNDMLMQIEGNVTIEEVHTKADENNDDIQNNIPINLENVLKYVKTP